MTVDVTRGAASLPLERKSTSPVVRGLLVLFFVGLTVLLLAILGAALFALRLWSQDRAAAKAVNSEVERLQAAGYPMTSDDLYRAHQIPTDTTDTTPAWLAAVKSFETGRTNSDPKGLPYVGEGDAALLRPTVSDSRLVAAEQFLSANDSTLQAILAADSQAGECRLPVKFEAGFSSIGQDAQNIRPLVRLLALNVHVLAIRGEADKALDSLGAMFAASDALSHQRTIVEHLVRLATLWSALSQTQLVLNELELTDAQLARIEQQLAGTDIQGGFTRSLIGERAMGYQAFDQMGVSTRSADRQRYLEMMEPMIIFSGQRLPAGRRHAQSLVAHHQAEQNAAPPWERHKYVLTTNVLPSLSSSFDAYATAVAYRDALLTAIAAERYRLKSGQFPPQLADLAPDYLVGIPLDPFDGQPLRFRAEGNEILIYSIARDGKDDGGQSQRGKSSEPDIVVRVTLKKATAP